MNAVETIKTVLEYIDNHIEQDLSCDILAKKVHYSSFHFHRIFLAVVGKTITEHIRIRRLEYASKMLSETNISCTQICYTCGFQSVQTFCRLFKAVYHVSPAQYRKLGTRTKIMDSNMIINNFQSRKKGDINMKPKFIKKDAFMLVGFEGHTRDGIGIIIKAWNQLRERKNEIPNIVHPETSYGFEDYSKDFKKDPMQFSYLASVEVSSLDNIPEGMTGKLVPASDYAVFTVKGNNENGEIPKAFGFIYNEWLPTSGYEVSDKVCGDSEFYDDRWDVESEDCEMDIYVPIIKK